MRRQRKGEKGQRASRRFSTHANVGPGEQRNAFLVDVSGLGWGDDEIWVRAIDMPMRRRGDSRSMPMAGAAAAMIDW